METMSAEKSAIIAAGAHEMDELRHKAQAAEYRAQEASLRATRIKCDENLVRERDAAVAERDDLLDAARSERRPDRSAHK